MAEVTPTFRARGAQGAEFVFDELVPGTGRAEVLGDQIRKGELTLLDDNGDAVSPDERDAFLSGLATSTADLRRIREGRAGPRDRVEPMVLDGDQVDEVPDAKVDDVVDWVRGGPPETEPTEGWLERAQEALDAEQAKDHPRKSLVEKLEDIIASAAPGE